VPARAVAALYIAFRRNGQVHTAVFMMISPEARVTLNIFLSARICHVISPSAGRREYLPWSQNGKSPEEISLPGFFACH